ncbi:unnamed protein product [Spirodela intermedia]|uniref:Uncharacterized protein n=1 Tax=Spirodela intermedia TaxID=51605 RepID=A0A7I8I8R0_SPIIN|nr:unnamed protein product [Spirodela intermedia]CAA6653452.1 unnamed protein product [Spirodela intermedia]
MPSLSASSPLPGLLPATDLARKGKAEFGPHNEQALFGFLSRGLLGKDPVYSGMGSDGPKLINKWVFFQLAPLLSLGIPPFLEDPLLHWFRLPPSLLQRDYQRLYDFFHRAAAPALNEAERMGISRAEACHNLLFAVCFNAFGGLKIFFPILLKWVSRAGMGIHTRLAMEIRTAVRSHGGEVSLRVMEEMPLMRSVVYEAFRIEPPVPLQFGRAKRDLLVQSHHAAYDVRRGEILFGYQPMATKDPMIFDRAEEFVGERFLGEGGPALLRRVLWSNGPETEVPTLDNKQCPGKDLVMIASRLLLVVLFLRYDSFDIETKAAPLGTAVTLTSLKKATF